jgi:aminoglycoside phosphotransferase (APT) family kinase protein
MSDFFNRMQNKETHTLVHGDLHFDNILVNETDRPIIVDWGAAGTANPCWDLVFFGPGELAIYLHARRTHGRRRRLDFLEDHRAAVAVRMFDLLRAAMNLKGQRPSEVRSAVDAIIRNLARVAQRPYRGGIGFRAARRPPKGDRPQPLRI